MCVIFLAGVGQTWIRSASRNRIIIEVLMTVVMGTQASMVASSEVPSEAALPESLPTTRQWLDYHY